MNPFICIQSVTITSFYLHSLIWIPLQIVFTFSQFLVVFSSKYITEPKL